MVCATVGWVQSSVLESLAQMMHWSAAMVMQNFISQKISWGLCENHWAPSCLEEPMNLGVTWPYVLNRQWSTSRAKHMQRLLDKSITFSVKDKRNNLNFIKKPSFHVLKSGRSRRLLPDIYANFLWNNHAHLTDGSDFDSQVVRFLHVCEIYLINDAWKSSYPFFMQFSVYKHMISFKLKGFKEEVLHDCSIVRLQ